MAHPLSLREKAHVLRSAGYSYSYISTKTGLSKGTLSGWLSEVSYIPNEETVMNIGKALAASGAKKASMKQATLLLAKQEARVEIGALSDRDIFMFGLGLYLGEGSKTHDIVRIVNSDPRVIRLAIAWFKSLGLTEKNFVITLHVYPDSSIENCIQYWSKISGVPREQFLKVQVDWRKDKKAYKLGKLPYGTAHLGIRSLGDKKYGVFFSRKILAWIEEMTGRVSKRD